ncbi:hypothetical protein PFTANZ_02540 [Plasmodium falciparum Tanzania (2000708)]|uniref:Uncharacterized protein n=1 Tax=Plasmodium falciparum Tanzania (2000708) TaxID=1036725 RepID=A0A024W7P0_PLAFA|nr:hypothetical protein PFTANZ_02540 [Plasmodium falciparum Tanzania (2000708)]
MKNHKGFYKVLQDFDHVDNVLVVASKQDKKGCMTLDHVRKELKIDKIVDRNW